MRRRVSSREHEPDRVVGRRFVDLDLLGCMLEVDDIGRIEQARSLGLLVRHPRDDRPLLGRGRVVDRDPHQEPVALCLGKRVHALRLDRVLGRHDQERLRHREGATADRDLSLGHRLQQCRLDARGRPVDLVDKDHVGDDRAGFDVEGLRRGPKDPGPDDVGRDQVRRELDAIERATQGPRQGREQQRLAEAGRALEEDVPSCQHGHEEPIDDSILADDDPAQLVADLGEASGGEVDVHGHAPVPSPPASGEDGSNVPSGLSPWNSSSRSCSIRRSIASAPGSFEPSGAGVASGSGVPAAVPGVRGKLAHELVEQLAQQLVGHVRTAVGIVRRLRSVRPEPEQVAQIAQAVGTEELIEEPTQRVDAVGRVVVLGLPRAVLDLVEDLPGLVDRHREADAVAAAGGARDGGVDADRPTLPVDQRTAGIAGVDRGIGLDQVVQLAHLGGDRAAECAHDAGGHRLAEAERAPDGDRHLADLHVGEGAEGHRLQIGRGALVGPDDGGVDGLVDRDHGAGDARAVLEPERDRLRSTDDVRCGEDEAAIGCHEPGAHGAVRLDLDDGREEPGGRIGERLIVRREHARRLDRPARATGEGQQRAELVAGGEDPGADEDDGARPGRRADDEPATRAPRGSGCGHRGCCGTGRRGGDLRVGPDEGWGRRQVAPALVLTIVAGEGVVHGSGLRIGAVDCRSDRCRSRPVIRRLGNGR